MSKVVITGSTGYLGSNLSSYLANKDVVVYAIYRPGREKEVPIHNNIIPICCDLSQIHNLKTKIHSKIDIFYHFGWEGVYNNSDNNYYIQSNNIIYTCEAVKIAKQLGCKKFIYPNTAMAPDSIAKSSLDDSKPNIRNIYYVAKETAHIMAKTLCFAQKIDFINAPITTIYGPGLKNSSFFNTMLIKMIHNEKCSLSRGNQYYDFIYIDDALEAFYLIGEKGRAYTTYYVGSDDPHTIHDYLIKMKRIVESKSELCFGDIKTDSIGIDLNHYDIFRLRKELNLIYKVPFEEGVKRCKYWLVSKEIG